MKTAFIFPGQGSQYVGMGKALHDSREDVRKLYGEASDATGIDIACISFDGPAELLNGDINAQLCVYVCNEAYRMVAAGMGITPDCATGYSLGFYNALVESCVLTFKEGLTAVHEAGRLVMESSAKDPGTMGAVIGLGLDELEAICIDASDNALGGGSVWVSNVNAARQMLVSGGVEAVGRAVALATERGALSAYNLPMGAAYHSPMMVGISDVFMDTLMTLEFKTPSRPLMSYLDACYLGDPVAIRRVVAGQLHERCLWKDTVTRIIADGSKRIIEVGPGQALTRMVRWVDRNINVSSLDTSYNSK